MRALKLKILLVAATVLFNTMSPENVAGQVTPSERTIRGTVVDAMSNEPLAGVSIGLKGTKTGTSTGNDGQFTLVIPENSILIVSHLGYTAKEVPVKGSGSLKITLEKSAVEQLEDVVIMGYVTKERSQVSSSVSVVSGKELNDVASSNVQSQLQGKVPGLIISNSSGDPTVSSNIVLRGTGTVNAGGEPLVVVDGIIGGNADPHDVESITVLRDAAATGLYGSRAANGVIIITTKSGKRGKTQVNLNIEAGVNSPTFGNFRVMNTPELYAYEKSFYPSNIFNRDIPDSLLATDIDWKNLAFRTGATQNYELSVSGAGEKTKFYVSGNYYKELGTIHHNSFEKYNFRSNITNSINKQLNLTVNVNAGVTKGEIEASGNYGALHGAFTNMPWDNPFNPDGTIKIGTETGWTGREHDNFLHGWQYNFNYSNAQYFDGDLIAKYSITKNLTLSSYNRSSYKRSDGVLYYDVRAKAGKGTGELTNDFYFDRSLVTSNRLEYGNTFGKHSLNGIAVIEGEKNYHTENHMFGKGLPPGLHVMNAAANIIALPNSGDIWENAFSKGLVQVNYSYSHRYNLVGAVINESSSVFGANNKSANFFTIAGSWILTNENFFNVEFVKNLKVRASYGSTGNAQIGNYQSLGLYSYAMQYSNISASYPFQLANPNLTWEKAKTVDVGIDFNLFNRIDVSVDWYDKTTKDLLLNVPLPYTSGYASVIKNVGSIGNKGVDIQMTTHNIVGSEFNWTTDFNVSFNKNRVLSLNQGKDITIDLQRVSIGRDIFSWYMRKWAGVDPENGDPLWEVVATDNNGNKTVTTTSNYNLATLQFVGTASPDYTGGIRNNLSYKNFSLSAFAYFVHGNLVFNSRAHGQDGAYPTYNDVALYKGQSRWESPGDLATEPKPVYGNPLISNKESSRYLESGSFIRLRNVSIGYDLPTELLSKLKINRLKIYVSGDNLWTGTRYLGIDPDVPLSRGNGSVGGADGDYKYPLGRKILFGVNVEF